MITNNHTQALQQNKEMAMFSITHRSPKSNADQIKSSVIPLISPKSSIVRQFITEVFKDTYHAKVDPRPDAFVICERNTDDGAVPLACAGLTFGFAREILFSEQYLDKTIEAAIADTGKYAVDRTEIVEIGSLASRHAAAASDLIRVLPIIAWFLGMRAILCTTTAGLRKLLDYHHIPFMALTEASSARLPEGERERWGSYYANSPLTGIISLQECGHLFSNHCGRFVFANLPGTGAGPTTVQSPVRQEAEA